MNHPGKIIITGDFCPINRIDDLISRKEYELIFKDFLPVLKEADLAITNLESPLTESNEKISKIGPLLKASTQSAAALSAAGFKLVTLANNHIMDYGDTGLISTFKACKEFGIDYVGAGENIQKARKIYTSKVRDRTIAILNFAENEFSTTNGSDHGANPLDPVDNYRDIIEARSIADIVLVIVHGGHEMYDLPSPRIKNTLHFFAEAGATVIIEHHAHCYSGYEVYRGVPIFYGLGNFLFDIPNMSNPIWNIGYAVELKLDPDLTFNIIPYQQCGKEAGISLLDGPEGAILCKFGTS